MSFILRKIWIAAWMSHSIDGTQCKFPRWQCLVFATPLKWSCNTPQAIATHTLGTPNWIHHGGLKMEAFFIEQATVCGSIEFLGRDLFVFVSLWKKGEKGQSSSWHIMRLMFVPKLWLKLSLFLPVSGLQAVGESLLYMLEKCHGPAFNLSTRKAWTKLYSVVVKAMSSGWDVSRTAE